MKVRSPKRSKGTYTAAAVSAVAGAPRGVEPGGRPSEGRPAAVEPGMGPNSQNFRVCARALLATPRKGCLRMKLRAGGRVLELDDPSSSSMAPIFSDTWLGTELWPAARALVAFLEERRTALATAAQVLELGA